jgi:seryl-tRNA synthetase
MILLKWIKNNTELFKEKMLIRKVTIDMLNNFFKIYDQWISLENELNGLRQQKNQDNSRESNEESKKLRVHIQEKSHEFQQLDDQLNNWLLQFPNILDEDVPMGANEAHNVEINKWMDGQNPQGNYLHFQMINNNLINKVTTMTQSRFIGLEGEMAQLHRAIGNFCLDFLKEEGFTEYLLPCVLNYEGFVQSGHVPFFENDLFWLEDKKLGLIPTSEVSIGNLLHENTFEDHQLPLKICCYSPCFRKEAGAAGKDTRGLIRLHQFHKVEMFMVTKPEDSHKYHEYMVGLVEKILKKLNLSHRRILLCSGDTGNHSSKTYDLEVWMENQNRWLEISSCSNIKDFQSVRLKSKYKIKGEKYYTHTLNGSCLPIERTVAIILENYQIVMDDKVYIMVPEVLKKYINKDRILVEKIEK